MANAQSQIRPKDVPGDPLIWSVLRHSGTVGLGSGVAGAALGGSAGLFRSKTPGLFALVAGAQCFSLGFCFTAARQVGLVALSQTRKTPVEALPANDGRIASVLGGAAAGGATASLFRSRSNVLPGVVVWAALGLAGQLGVEVLSPKLQAGKDAHSPGLVDRMTASKWSPLTKLSDEEYQRILNERLLRVDADIALVDEEIAKLNPGSGENNT